MGWDDESVVLHLMGYISDRNLEDEFQTYCVQAAQEEGAMVDAYDSIETITDEAGWDEDSQIVHMHGFLESHGYNYGIATYFEKIASEEIDDSL
jgi:hypothetical protein